MNAHRSVAFEVKDVSNANGVGTFEGYAAVYGNIDRVNDIIEPGAFNGSFRNPQEVSLLWSHSQCDLIGGIKSIDSDNKGLYVKGELNMEVRRGYEAYHLMKSGHLNKMSIGYRTKSWKDEVIAEKYIRRIMSVNLYEISLVAVPANEDAEIVAIKSLGDLLASANIKNLNTLLRNNEFSRSQTERITGIVKKWLNVDLGEHPQGITEDKSGDTAELEKAIKGFSFLSK